MVLPAGYIQRRNRRADVSNILDAAAQREAVAIVVGMPYDPQGRPGEQARKTEAFIRALRRTTEISIFTVDEAFTSSAATADLLDSGRSPSRERGAVDEGAAVAILRRFLSASR